MSGRGDSGEKTRQPTRRRLRDARRDGQVARSQDLSRTLVLAAAVLLLLSISHVAIREIQAFSLLSWRLAGGAMPGDIIALAWVALRTGAGIVLPLLLVLALIGGLADYLQIGPVFATRRITPNPSHMNPVEGLKRLFSPNSLIEVTKSIIKTTIVLALGVWVAFEYVPSLLKLPHNPVSALGTALQEMTLWLLSVSVGALLMISAVDLGWQRFYFRRQMRMSVQEVKREQKDSDGDPQLKGQRRRLLREWASKDIASASRRATVMVLNPTQVAVALHFDPTEPSLPKVIAKGRGSTARLMRDTARAEGIPMVRNVTLARQLERTVDIDDPIPEELFDAVAEILVWAEQAKASHDESHPSL